MRVVLPFKLVGQKLVKGRDFPKSVADGSKDSVVIKVDGIPNGCVAKGYFKLSWENNTTYDLTFDGDELVVDEYIVTLPAHATNKYIDYKFSFSVAISEGDVERLTTNPVEIVLEKSNYSKNPTNTPEVPQSQYDALVQMTAEAKGAVAEYANELNDARIDFHGQKRGSVGDNIRAGQEDANAAGGLAAQVRDQVNNSVLPRLETLEQGGLQIKDEYIAEQVNGWLADHPEATTTVQDKSLTEDKFSDALKMAAINNFVTPQMYGAVGDGETDDTEAFKAAVNSGKNVFVPSGTYLLTDFSVDTKCIITGENKNTTRLECNGISLNAEAEISQVHIEQRDATKTAVLVNKSGCYVHECNIYCGNIGLELSAAKHIIGGVFRNLTIGYCKHAGVKAIASGGAQKNQILYEHLYIVNTGENTQDSSAPSTELENGFGMYIDGGYGVEIRNCVFEYNSGAGLYLGMTYPLVGCNVTSPYFEYNKYAQLYINNIDGTYMENVHVSGDFYTDAGRSLPANSLKNRGMCLRLNTNLTSKESVQGNHFSSESGKTIAFNNRYCPNNLFPFDVIGEMKSDYIPLADYNGETVMKHGKGYHTLNGVPIHIEKGEYTVSVDLSTDGANTDWFGFYLVGHPDGNKTYTIHSNNIGKDGSWKTVSFDVAFNGVGVCSIQTNNNSPNYPVYIKNIRIVKKDARLAEVDTKFTEVDSKFTEVNTKLNANRYCPNNLFPFDVIGEAAGTDIVGDGNRMTLGEYNGETVWERQPGGVTLYTVPIYVEKGDYQLTFEIATVEGNNDLLLFGLSSHPDGSKVASNRATTEWRTVTNNISFTKMGTCYLYASNQSATNPFYIRNIRIVRLYPAAPTDQA